MPWKIVKGGVKRLSEVYILEQVYYVRPENTLAVFLREFRDYSIYQVGTNTLARGEGDMSMVEKPVVAVLRRPRSVPPLSGARTRPPAAVSTGWCCSELTLFTREMPSHDDSLLTQEVAHPRTGVNQ